VIHLDNCSAHTNQASTDWLEEHSMRRLSHPPTLFAWFGLSNFFLFPTVKEKLERIQMADKDQFFKSLQEILRDIDQEELNGVFQV
jgi:hypothetical protein